MAGMTLIASLRSRACFTDAHAARQFELANSGLPAPSDISQGDVVIVSSPSRRWFGKLCIVVYAERRDVELARIKHVNCTSNGVEIEGDKKKDTSLSVQASDVCRLAIPYTRQPLEVPDIFHFLRRDFRHLSTKRFSEGRLRHLWAGLSPHKQGQYEREADSAKTVHKRVLRHHCASWNVIRDFLGAAPKLPPTNGYMLFHQETSLPGFSWKASAAAAGERWRALPESDRRVYESRARQVADSHRQDLSAYLEVALGKAWSEQRAAFFPKSAKRCLLVLLLCQKSRGTLASRISKHIWVEHIFVFIPWHWFLSRIGEKSMSSSSAG